MVRKLILKIFKRRIIMSSDEHLIEFWTDLNSFDTGRIYGLCSSDLRKTSLYRNRSWNLLKKLTSIRYRPDVVVNCSYLFSFFILLSTSSKIF